MLNVLRSPASRGAVFATARPLLTIPCRKVTEAYDTASELTYLQSHLSSANETFAPANDRYDRSSVFAFGLAALIASPSYAGDCVETRTT